VMRKKGGAARYGPERAGAGACVCVQVGYRSEMLCSIRVRVLCHRLLALLEERLCAARLERLPRDNIRECVRFVCAYVRTCASVCVCV
jgi:hypothetical protein